MTASLPHPGQRTPSGQRCWRTSAKHLASSNSSERLTRSDEGMTAKAPCATAAADQPPASSQQKPHATATRSPASQHPGSQQEPLTYVQSSRYLLSLQRCPDKQLINRARCLPCTTE